MLSMFQPILKKEYSTSMKIQATYFGTNMFLLVLLCGLVTAQNDTGYYGNSDSMVFPGPVGSRNGRLNYPKSTERYAGGSELSKSLRLAQEINSLQSINDFLQLVDDIPKNQRNFFLNSRFGETEERSNGERAIPAKCMPELQPIPLKQNDDPSTMYYPSCTRIKRCGGCCGHALLSCQPTASEIRNFEVLVVTVGTSMGLNYKGKTIVPLEEHTKCKCDCRIKPEHCTEKQSYVPEECTCVCNNVDEEEKCRRSNDIKVWHPDFCTCRCRTQQECNTGFYFDQNTCRCQQVPLSRSWFAPTKGANYKIGETEKPETVPPVIVALDAADPRRKPKDDPEYK